MIVRPHRGFTAHLLFVAALFALTQGEVYAPPRLTFYVQVRGKGKKQKFVSPVVVAPAKEENDMPKPVILPGIQEIKVASRNTERAAPKSMKFNNPLASFAKRWSAKKSFLISRPTRFSTGFPTSDSTAEQVKRVTSKEVVQVKPSIKPMEQANNPILASLGKNRWLMKPLWLVSLQSSVVQENKKPNDPKIKKVEVSTQNESTKLRREKKPHVREWSPKLSQRPKLASAAREFHTQLQRGLSKSDDKEEDDSYLLGWYILCFSVGLMFDTLF